MFSCMKTAVFHVFGHTKMRPHRSAFLIIYHIHFIISKTGICMIRINPIIIFIA